MLVILSETLCDTDLRGPLSDMARDAICNLGLAHHEGSHLISVSHRLKRCILALKEIGERERRAFVRTSWDLELAQRLRAEVPAYVLVHPLGTPWKVDIPAGGAPAIFAVDLSYFATSERAQPTRLVSEYQRDASWYHRLADAYRWRHRRDTSLRVRGIDGGGVNTGPVFREQARRGMALCIVDSDAHAIDAEPRDTALRALGARAELHDGGFVADAHTLMCHELENLVPAQLVLDAAPSGQDGDLIRQHAASLGKVDHADLKKLIGKRMLAGLDELLNRTTAAKLAEYCFGPDHHPYLAELGALVWSWGLGPPSGKARV